MTEFFLRLKATTGVFLGRYGKTVKSESEDLPTGEHIYRFVIGAKPHRD